MEVHNAEMQRTQLIRDSCDVLQCEHSSTDINFGFHYILSGIYCCNFLCLRSQSAV